MKRAGMWRDGSAAARGLQFSPGIRVGHHDIQCLAAIHLRSDGESDYEGEGRFPAHSSVGAQAVREFDGNASADGLCGLLSDFDEMIEKRMVEWISSLYMPDCGKPCST